MYVSRRLAARDGARRGIIAGCRRATQPPASGATRRCARWGPGNGGAVPGPRRRRPGARQAGRAPADPMTDDPRASETKATTIGDAQPLGARDDESERVTLVVYEDTGDEAAASTRVLDLVDGAH